jgi:hypothetical protein
LLERLNVKGVNVVNKNVCVRIYGVDKKRCSNRAMETGAKAGCHLPNFTYDCAWRRTAPTFTILSAGRARLSLKKVLMFSISVIIVNLIFSSVRDKAIISNF